MTNNPTRIWHDIHYRHTTPESNPKAWRPFIEIDPFNPQNRVAGNVQFTGGDEYGALAITHVNDRPAPQFIRVTPKAAYPFHKDGSWILTGAQRITAFEKIDGTNVGQYCYVDADGTPFTTFKLRIRPFIPPHFLIMLERALEQYPGIREHRLQPGCAVAYEMFGYDNPMLIRYDRPIDLALIFGRTPDGNIIAPQDDHPMFEGIDCPQAVRNPYFRFHGRDETADTEEVETAYRTRQAEISSQLTKIGEEQFDGQEGEMLYVEFADGARTAPGQFTRLIKLKPPEIEEIHWALDHVPMAEAAAVARNVFEAAENPEAPNLDDMLQLLAEEWTEAQIARSIQTIERALADAVLRRAFQDQVLRTYGELHDADDFRNNRPSVMRTMSRHFPKQQMSRVYSVLVERGYG